MHRYVQSWILSILLITAVIVGSHTEHDFTFTLSQLITFNAAGGCSADDRFKMLQKCFKISQIVEFHYYIWNCNEKCIQISINMPGICCNCRWKRHWHLRNFWENEVRQACADDRSKNCTKCSKLKKQSNFCSVKPMPEF